MEYKLTSFALSDLEKIYNYTSRVWGKLQAKKYIYIINESFELISQFPKIGKVFRICNNGEELRVLESKNHRIFYIAKNDIKIISILYEKMDWENHILKRL